MRRGIALVAVLALVVALIAWWAVHPPAGAWPDQAEIASPGGGNATTAAKGGSAAGSSGGFQRPAPPGWRIEVTEQYVMEYPARRIAGDARRYVFYYWNGSLYLEEGVPPDYLEYARYVGRVLYIEIENRTVRRIHGQNPLRYTQYNITFYPAYSYRPRANLTPVEMRDLQILIAKSGAGVWGYNISGVVPKGQVYWSLLHLADRYFNASILAILRVGLEMPELEPKPVEVVHSERLVMHCADDNCNILEPVKLIK